MLSSAYQPFRCYRLCAFAHIRNAPALLNSLRCYSWHYHILLPAGLVVYIVYVEHMVPLLVGNGRLA